MQPLKIIIIHDSLEAMFFGGCVIGTQTKPSQIETTQRLEKKLKPTLKMVQ